MSKPRLLLVHANPFQRAVPVPAYGLERLRTAVADLAEVRIVDPCLTAADSVSELRAQAKAFAPDLVGMGVRVIEDCIVIDGSDGPSSSADVFSFLPEILELRQAIAAAAPNAPLVVGGAAFSYFPAEMLEYLDAEYGVAGAGEGVLRELVSRFRSGVGWENVPGLIRRGEDRIMALGQAQVSFPSAPTVREDIYTHVNGFPVRTRIGCAMRCSYCLTANLARRHEESPIELVMEEIEAIVAASRERDCGQARLFFANDEFNLPNVEHTISILEEIVVRGLADQVVWRAYFNPTPFPDRLAELIKETSGHVSLTVDSASDPVLKLNGKPFRRQHLDAAIATIVKHELSTDLGFIFGLPGESEETLADSVAFIRSLPKEIEVCYSSGARVYPHTPLAALAAADPGHILGEVKVVGLEPLVYCALCPPRELAQRLQETFVDLDHVYPVGAGFASSGRAQGLAYQALTLEREEGQVVWSEALADAGHGGYNSTRGDVMRSLLEIAIWHGRHDLAMITGRELLKLPAKERGMSRTRIWLAMALHRSLGHKSA